MEFNKFVRKPFVIEAIEVTEENIAELSKSIGTLCKKADGTPYIQVDRQLVPIIDKVYPGFWVTKMEHNVRCYSERTFKEQFVKSTEDIEKWVSSLNQRPEVVADGV